MFGVVNVHGLGINGKISELQAAMGLAVLPYMSSILEGRRKVIETYDHNLGFSKFKRLILRDYTQWNYSYYPITFESEKEILKVQKKLSDNGIFARRYFYPSLNTLPYIKNIEMPISESISERILCLPLYVGLSSEEMSLICNLINTDEKIF
jgi:dTDP-4-amino-4,6-dideoxygalactose transaminase